MILAFGGIPLIWYGDEIATFNDDSFLQDPSKAADSRWVHRPLIDWERAERRHTRGTAEQRVFDGLKRLIAVRKTIPAFADFNNRELIDVDNPHLFAFLRTHPTLQGESVLVVANFDAGPQYLDLDNLGSRGRVRFGLGPVQDLANRESPAVFNGRLVIPPFRYYWLTDQRLGAVL
jgi:amylosucrase